jgi:cytochrome c oxidase subunit 2
VRSDLIKLWLTVALAIVLAGATVAVYQAPTDEPPSATLGAGALLFQAKGCSGCHTIVGVTEIASIGPDLTHLSEAAGGRIAGMSARAYVTQSIRQPQAFTVQGFPPDLMPTFELSDSQVESLVAFLLADR